MSGPRRKHGPLGITSFLNRRQVEGNCHLREKLLRDEFSRVPSLFRKDLRGHFGCVNAIEFSKAGGGEMVISGGDDRRVLLWNLEEGISGRAKPRPMKGEHHSNIFCLAFDNSNSKIYSGGNDEQVVVHDLATGTTLDVFVHQDAVYGLSVDPLNDNVFASACDDGRILIYDIRLPPSEEPFCLANYGSQMHAVVYNPMEPRLLATANAKEGVGLWDVRKPQSCLLRYGGSLSAQSCMSVQINSRGDQVLALRRRLPPVLYHIESPLPVFQFDHAGYYNSCTMKSCCFAGEDDQYVISGSDDFNLYIWKVPGEQLEVPWVGEAHLVLRGHRSIVNQVRFNASNHIIISSGVEKLIKMWSPFEMPDSVIAPFSSAGRTQALDPFTTVAEAAASEAQMEERPVYTPEEYFSLLLRSGQVISHDYSHQSTDEDPRMMAFFDALVQRELQGFSSDDDSFGSGSNIFGHYIPSDNSNHSDTPVEEQTVSEDEGVVSRTEQSAPLQPQERVMQDIDTNNDSNTQQQLLDMDAHTSSSSPHERPVNFIPHRSLPSTASSRNQSSNQRSQSKRPSIADLITMKRKEYVNNAKKVDRKIRKRHSRKDPNQNSSTETDGSSSSSSESTSSSSTRSSESSGLINKDSKIKRISKRRRRLKRRRSPIPSENDSSPERPELEQENVSIASVRDKLKANKKNNFSKLKKIRSHILQNDNSDSEDSNIAGDMSKMNCLKKSLHNSANNLEINSDDTQKQGLEKNGACSSSYLSSRGTLQTNGHNNNDSNGCLLKTNTQSHLSKSLTNGSSFNSFKVSDKDAITSQRSTSENGTSTMTLEELHQKVEIQTDIFIDKSIEDNTSTTVENSNQDLQFKRIPKDKHFAKRKYRRRSQDSSSGNEAV